MVKKLSSGPKKPVSKLFKKNNVATKILRGSERPPKGLISSSAESAFREVESVAYVESFLKDKERFKPNVDFSDPKNFVRFGSAEEYYEKAIENIYKTYPYDGSKKEKYDWHNSSSYFDNYFFEYEYPRTNGFISIGQTWTTDGTADQDSTDKIVAATSPQYISIKGGPHGPSTPTYDTSLEHALDYKDPKNKANIYNDTIGQIQNLTIDGATGNTVEFWMKLPLEPSKSQTSPSHAYFDLWNESTAITAGGDYGRFLIETRLKKTLNGEYIGDSIFYISYGSGSYGVSRAKVGPTTLSGAYGINLADWNHYAFVVQNNLTGSDHLEMNLYINGTLVDTVHTGSQIAAVSTGPLNANIGAYRFNPIPSLSVSNGEGSLSGSSFDEFRFWKTARNEKQISFNWFTQVAGGTNTDFGSPESKYSGSVNPVDLGVYYKFNEGITGYSSQDRTIIDYSGRVSNGTFNNYSNNPPVRSVGSAIVSSSAADREFKDPILYENHPDVITLQNAKQREGVEYDTRNAMSMYHMIPQWILDEDSDKNRFEVKKLTQIISSYFDELYLQTEELDKLKDYAYISGSISGSMYKPLPFANKLLESRGFVAPELFSTADVMSVFANRDDKREFKTELANVKNQIYTNIYNNLDFINKSKGTEKSIRNLVRCFGVDDDIFSLSFYANNAEITLNQSITPKIITKNFVNFSTASNFEALVYQSTASSNTNESMFITGSSNNGFDKELGFTVEADVIFPAILDISNPKKPEMEYSPVSASLFGMHSALISPSSDGDTTWAANDYASFQVYAAREENPSVESQYSVNTVRFVLTGTNVNSTTEAAFPYLVSDKFEDVYDDEKWHFAVKVKPSTYPNLGIVSGTSGYDVEFHGYNTQADTVINSFVLTGSVSSGANVLSSKKRLYIGAHRTNYTGSLRVGSNARISSCRYWVLPLEKEEIISHAVDISNSGLFDPMDSAYLFQNYGVSIPKIKTLALSWDFNTVSGSNVNGEFFVKDFSSGSSDNQFKNDLSDLLLKQHTGRGLFFDPSNTNAISKQYVYSYKQQVPENLDSSDAVKILNKDQEFFTPRTKPVSFSFAVEKSMYQAISEQMLNFLACSAEASGLEGLIGDPINKYRSEYKLMKKIREIFFQRVGNTPDLDKYLEYYKWLDTSITSIIGQLVPASSEVDTVSNLVESHVFERNKYTHKFPTMEFSSNEPSGSFNSINELLYSWQYGHAPYPQAVGRDAVVKLTNNLTTPIVFTSNDRQHATYRNGERIRIDVLAAAANPSNTVLVNFAASGSPRTQISIIITPNNGTNNSGTPVNLTTAELVQLVNNGSVSGKNITITDSSSVRTLQRASGGDSNNFVNGGEGDSAQATFADGADSRDQTVNCNWWNKKIDREDPLVSTGIANVDVSRANIHSASIQAFNRNFSRPYKLSVMTSHDQLKTEYNKRGVVLTELPPFAHTRAITFNTSTFVTSSVVCADDAKINPNLKKKAEYQVQLNDNTNTQSKYSSGLVSPYSFYEATINNRPTGVPTGFQVGPDHLRDYYTIDKIVPMQGPFTKQHVGGNQYRNLGFVWKPIQINTGADPRKDPRPEAWVLSLSLAGGNLFYTIVNPSYYMQFGRDLPRADFTRDLIAKRPVNIKNILTVNTTTSSSYGGINSIGNYTQGYEIVQAADRSINNRYFVENNGISTSSVASTTISGLQDHTVPDRGKHSYVMVNRFSSPGGPEVNSPGYLDYESETFSVYNALPFRNLSVRQPLKQWLTKHSAFGGYDSVYGSPSASYHKVQRNGAKRIKYSAARVYSTAEPITTASVYDNYWVQHMVPQSDLQYSWITASAISFPFGYAQPDPSNAGEASTDIGFVLESDFGAFAPGAAFRYGMPKAQAESLGGMYAQNFIPLDFVGLNTIFVPSFSAFTNTISSFELSPRISTVFGDNTFGAANLNAQLLNLNGPGGFSSWKQLRQSENPIVRYHNRNNLVSLMTQSVSASPVGKEQLKNKDIVTYKEPSVVFSYKPLQHNLTMNNGERIVVKSTYANNLHTFNNKAINQIIGFEAERGDEVYDDLKRIYIDKDLGPHSPISSFNYLNYQEKVFPRKMNAGLSRTRGRDFYTVNRDGERYGTDEIRNFHGKMGTSIVFWKNDINDRLRNDSAGRLVKESGMNAQGVRIYSASAPLGLIDLSVWPLDAEEPFFDYYLVSASAGLSDSGFDPYYWSPMGPSGAMLNPTLEPRWNNASKNGELSYAGWLISLYNFNLDGKWAKDGTSAGRGPLFSVRGTGARVTASFQYEYPNMIWSGSFPYGQRWDDEYGSGGNDLAFMFNQASASLHLIPPYRADVLSGRTPWFNSYEDYAEDIRLMAKEYSVLPEFKISDHIEYYINNGFESQNNKFLDLLGTGKSPSFTGSAQTETSNFRNQFFTLYSNSDFLSKFVEISEDHKKNSTALPSSITLRVNAIKKLLPYQGFYPALRAVQLGQLFSASYSPHISGSNTYASSGGTEAEAFNERLAALYQPFFAPGIFFNTIKSGLAVDYPVHTGSVPSTLGSLSTISGKAITNLIGVNAPFSASNTNLNMLTDDPNFSFPFEAILNPNRYLPITASSDFKNAADIQDGLEGYTSGSVYFVYPHFTGSLDTTANPSFADPWDAASGTASSANKRPEIFFTWNGQADISYSLAANNFFAEVENLFLQRRSPTSFVSKAEKDFVSMASGSVYMMDVVLSKTEDFVSFEGPSGSFNFLPFTGSTTAALLASDPDNLLGRGRVNDNKVSVRGMHYGPPYIAQPLYFGNPDSGSAYFEDPCYAPHTPPYFYGDAVARIIVRPDQIEDMAPNSTRKFELRDIIANAQVYTKYFNTNKRAKDLQNQAHKDGFPAGRYQMQISSSVNLFGSLTLKQVDYKTEQDENGNFIPNKVGTTVLQDSQDAWVIESKFECPSINLNAMDVLSLGAGSNGNERLFTRGIWKGYGTPPTGSDGIYIQIRESDPRRVDNPQFMNDAGTAPATGSLINVCGFQADKVRVGEIASEREISEAIVAIPINSKGEFYNIDADVFLQQLINITNGEPAVKQGQFGATEDVKETSISNMINKMNKYYLPPQLDPIRNATATPVVMYIFEFKHILTKSDLSYMWQNLMPDIAMKAEKDQATIQHNLKTKYEFFGNDQYMISPFQSVSKDIRWMVFKVKQRAKNNYSNVTKQSDSALGFSFTSDQEMFKFTSSPDKELKYSYNWPYDFFSLVELAELEVGYSFNPPISLLEAPNTVQAQNDTDNIQGSTGGQAQISSQAVANQLKNAGLP